jgi:hypothetical protein
MLVECFALAVVKMESQSQCQRSKLALKVVDFELAGREQVVLEARQMTAVVQSSHPPQRR